VFSLFAATDYAAHNPPEAPHEDQQIETVSFCELTNHPERYVNKSIKTSAIFLTHFPDVWFMYDENCPEKSNRVTDYLNCRTEAECARLKNLSSLHRDGDGEKWRTKMVVIGQLHVVEAKDRSNTPTHVLKFAVTDIESVTAVSPSVLWP
jgi:hypothetical protein